MERKELKRGFEEMNLEKEEESAAKQPKPSGRMSEIVKEETNKDEEFEDLSPYCSKRPVCGEESEAVNLGSKEETSVKQTEFSGKNEEFHPDDCSMSDDWLYISWQNNTSSLWVVTKSPDSLVWMKDALKSDVCNQYKIVQEQKTFEIDLNEKFKNRVSSCSCVLFCFGNDQWDSGSLQEVADLSSSYGMKKVIILLSEKSPDTWPPEEMNDQHNFPVLKFSKQEIAWYKDNLESSNKKIESMKKIVKDSWKGYNVFI
ncbi:uncharacterized protein LOC142246822 [Anomaloglossus baeobatrachus]|uniref:uncharacterized protein LOC142246822 n=1 Tax=Anomaloglossus baeobatrachus TaxID=238106 RepID=UPI003F505835